MALPLPEDLKGDRGEFPNYHRHMPLWCEASYGPERSLTLGEATLRQAKIYGFDPQITDSLQTKNFYHEAAHLLIGLAFRRLGFSPVPYDFPQNGNYAVESLVLAVEYFLQPNSLINELERTPSPPLFWGRYNIYYKEHMQHESDLLSKALNHVKESTHPMALFDAYKARGFEFGERLQRLPELPERTGFDERLPLICPLPRLTLDALFTVMLPALNYIKSDMRPIIEREDFYDLLPAKREARLMDHLRKISVASLWQEISKAHKFEVEDFTHNHRQKLISLSRIFSAAGVPLTRAADWIEASQAVETHLIDRRRSGEQEYPDCLNEPDSLLTTLGALGQMFHNASHKPDAMLLRTFLAKTFLKKGYEGLLEEAESLMVSLSEATRDEKILHTELSRLLSSRWRERVSNPGITPAHHR
jgi:hypothetical protein